MKKVIQVLILGLIFFSWGRYLIMERGNENKPTIIAKIEKKENVKQEVKKEKTKTIEKKKVSKINKKRKKLPKNVDKTEHWVLTSTYYNPVKEQCDDRPLEVASGDLISLSKLKSGKLKWVAISQDLLKLGFKLNDMVYIEELEDYYFIKDTMNKRYTRHIDILQHLNHEPLAYETLTIRKVIC